MSGTTSDFKPPRGERCWAGYYNAAGNALFAITSKETRDQYFLYDLRGSEPQKVGKAKEPPELIKKNHVLEIMRGVKGYA